LICHPFGIWKPWIQICGENIEERNPKHNVMKQLHTCGLEMKSDDTSYLPKFACIEKLLIIDSSLSVYFCYISQHLLHGCDG